MVTAQSSNVFVVIPAFNEFETIGMVVRALDDYSVVVVDDGSVDATAEIALDEGATVLRHVVNLGQGAALQTGLEYATKANAAFIVTFDADGQHDPNDIEAMISAIRDGRNDVVLGSRFLGQAVGLPPLRRAVLKLAVWSTRILTGMRITDVHNGFRAFTAEAAKKISLKQNRMAHASEILRQIADLDLKYQEVPVTVRYTHYSLGKGQRLVGAFDILIDLLKRRIEK